MALDQSALLNLLGELKLTDVTDRIRVATETLYQELIDAEATAFIGAAPFERSGDRTTHRCSSHWLGRLLAGLEADPRARDSIWQALPSRRNCCEPQTYAHSVNR
jgi:hypothetical protein